MKIYIKSGFAALAVMILFGVFAVSETKAQGQGILNEILKRMDEHQKALQLQYLCILSLYILALSYFSLLKEMTLLLLKN